MYKMLESWTVEWPRAKFTQLCLIWGKQGTSQAMEVMRLRTYCLPQFAALDWCWLTSKSHDWGQVRLSWIKMALPIFRRLYPLGLVDLTFRNRGSGVPTQVLSHRVAYLSSKRHRNPSLRVFLHELVQGWAFNGRANWRIHKNRRSLAAFLGMESFCHHPFSHDRLINRQWLITDDEKWRCPIVLSVLRRRSPNLHRVGIVLGPSTRLLIALTKRGGLCGECISSDLQWLAETIGGCDPIIFDVPHGKLPFFHAPESNADFSPTTSIDC